MNEQKVYNLTDLNKSNLEFNSEDIVDNNDTKNTEISKVIDNNKNDNINNDLNKTKVNFEPSKLNIKKKRKQNNYFSISNLKIPFSSYFEKNEYNIESLKNSNNNKSTDSQINNKIINYNDNKIPTPKVFKSTDYTLIDQITLNELDNLRAELKEGVDFKLYNFKGDLSTELDEKIKQEFKKGIDWEIDNFKNELKKTTINFQKNNNINIDKISWKTFSLGLICNSFMIYYLYNKYLKI